MEDFRQISDSREGAGREDERNSWEVGGGKRGEGFSLPPKQRLLVFLAASDKNLPEKTWRANLIKREVGLVGGC